MKLIVDFDDVLFNAAGLKETFFKALENKGIQSARDEYHFERKNDRPFSLKLFLKRICDEKGIVDSDALYQEVMEVCKDLVNKELVEVLKEHGMHNCYIVTNGEEEFQKDKITRTGLESLVREVIVVPGAKKEVVEMLCAKYPTETIIFIDDKNKFFTDITMEACPNLKTVVYNENGLENLKAEIAETKKDEQSKVIAAPQEGGNGPTMK